MVEVGEAATVSDDEDMGEFGQVGLTHDDVIDELDDELHMKAKFTKPPALPTHDDDDGAADELDEDDDESIANRSGQRAAKSGTTHVSQRLKS